MNNSGHTRTEASEHSGVPPYLSSFPLLSLTLLPPPQLSSSSPAALHFLKILRRVRPLADHPACHF